MVDTTTPVLGLVRQTIGGNRNTWGAILNSCMDLIEGAFYGMTSKVVTGGSYTLTDSERRKRILSFAGTLNSEQTIVVANLVGRWTVRNSTTGNYALKMKTSAGTAVEIPQGYCDVWCDGNDVVYAGLSSRLRDTQMVAPDGTDDAPGYGFKNETNSGWQRVSLGLFAFVVGGVRVLTIAGTALRVAITDAGLAVTGALSVSGAVSCATLTVGGQTPIPIGAGSDYDGIREPNGWKFRNGQALNRTTYALLFAVLSESAAGTRTAGSAVLSSVDKDLTGLGLEGAVVEATGFASGTTISSVTSNSITLSNTAVGNGATTIRIFPHGNGDGSTTFNVPDDRGRTTAGHDGMGVTAAGRLTNQSGGVDGAKLGKAGGSETHTLTTNQLAAHAHNAYIRDPGHAHGQRDGEPGGTGNISGYGIEGGAARNHNTETSQTGVKVNSQADGLGTDDLTASTGGGAAHNNVQPTRITNKIIFTGVYV